jgi:hypothetical protein
MRFKMPLSERLTPEHSPVDFRALAMKNIANAPKTAHTPALAMKNIANEPLPALCPSGERSAHAGRSSLAHSGTPTTANALPYNSKILNFSCILRSKSIKM